MCLTSKTGVIITVVTNNFLQELISVVKVICKWLSTKWQGLFVFRGFFIVKSCAIFILWDFSVWWSANGSLGSDRCWKNQSSLPERKPVLSPVQMLDTGEHLSAGEWKAFSAEHSPLSQRQSLSETWPVSPASVCSVWQWWPVRGEGRAVLLFPALTLKPGAVEYAVTSEVMAAISLALASLHAASSREDFKWFNKERSKTNCRKA